MKRALITLALAINLLAATPGIAVQPGEMLSDPALEARARDISRNLRCLVCQNQSIDDSDADLARDLRVLVRERLKVGDGDKQVVAYIVDRYGDFVLLDPPFKAATLVLWLGPAAIALAGIGAVLLYFLRQRRRLSATPNLLSEEERKRLEALLGEDRP